jgi:hypothetical protein
MRYRLILLTASIALAALVGAPASAEDAAAEPPSADAAQAPLPAGGTPPGEEAVPPSPAAPSPPSGLTVTPEIVGPACQATIAWIPSPDAAQGRPVAYKVYRRDEDAGAYTSIGESTNGATSITDTACKFRANTVYRVVAFAGGVGSRPTESAPQTFVRPLIDSSKWMVFVLGVVISASIIYFINHARSGKKLFIRKIAGLEAVDEAIGRATEMGRPILFIPGIMDMNDVQTVSAVIILGRIARTIAEYDTRLFVPTSKSLVMTTARETVKEAYMAAGRPDAYNDDMITYLTDEQFGYVAGVNGIMVREKPATCFFLGSFFAESLILAETGNSIGAIQVAGTAQPSQLPFFIAACDYTLIGEELFAASAYLSHEPMQLGSLKGQDVGKAIAMLAILVGTILHTVAALSGSEALLKWAATFGGWFAS